MRKLFRIFVLCLTVCLLTFGRSALADRMVLLPPLAQAETSLQRAPAQFPNLSQAELEELYLKPALLSRIRGDVRPVRLRENDLGTYLDGYVIDYLTGPRTGNPLDPNNWDTIVFQAHGPGGEPAAPQAFRISSQRVHVLQHTIDQPNDLTWELSDRHLKLGVGFGSDKHQQSIYALFDPDGELEMYRGGASAVQVTVKGRLINYLLDGPPSAQAFFGQTP